MVLMLLRLLLGCLMPLMSGLMVALFVLDQVTGVSSSGAGFFAHQPEDCWGGRRWGHVVRPDGEVPSGRGFCSVPVPLQSVQRAEMWGVILALQSVDAVHFGVDKSRGGSSC